jgi:hypothetical protein
MLDKPDKRKSFIDEYSESARLNITGFGELVSPFVEISTTAGCLGCLCRRRLSVRFGD